MAITTQDQLIAALGSSNTYMRHSWYVATTIRAFGWVSYFTANGSPGGGATPTSLANPTSSTTGAINIQNAQSGNSQYLAKFTGWMANFVGSSPQSGMLVLYDRLAHIGGLSGTVTTAQNVDPSATNPVNRGPGTTTGSITWPGNIGDGVEIWMECYTVLGATAATITASYTNNSGTASRTTTAVNVPISMIAQSAIVLPLQAGDTGVRSVQSVTLSGSTGTAGNFGITLVRRVAEIPFNNGIAVGNGVDAYQLGLPQIYDNACLSLIGLSGVGTGALEARASMAFCQG